MALRARKVSGIFEKRPPGLLCTRPDAIYYNIQTICRYIETFDLAETLWNNQCSDCLV